MDKILLRKEDTNRPTKIVVMCCDGPHHYYLIDQLKQRFPLAGLVIETDQNQMDWLRKKGKSRLWWYRKYHSKRRVVQGYGKQRKQFFDIDAAEAVRDIPAVYPTNVNDQTTIDFLNSIDPDLTIVCGTMYIGKKSRKAGNNVINLHGGILPEYKGNHCIFFAQYEGSIDKIGATIHLVSDQLDGGSVIKTVRPDTIDPSENDELLYNKSLVVAVKETIKLIDDFNEGKAVVAESQPASDKKVYSHVDRTPFTEVKCWMSRLGRKYRSAKSG